MGAELVLSRDLEIGEGIVELPDSSVDLVLFCEILEHLAFNPILTWKQIYRVLCPGGRIVLTTPNGNFWRRLETALNRLLGGLVPDLR